MFIPSQISKLQEFVKMLKGGNQTITCWRLFTLVCSVLT